MFLIVVCFIKTRLMREWRLPAKDDTIPCRGEGAGTGGGRGGGMAKLGMTRSLEHVATHTRGRTCNEAW